MHTQSIRRLGRLLSLALPLLAGAAHGMEYRDGAAALASGNAVKAVKIWTALAEKNDPIAQQGLGYMYSNPMGKIKWKADYAKAGFWYQKCETALSGCAFGLAKLLEEGQGVKQDTVRAAQLYRGIATSGSDYAEEVNQARVRLGGLYWTGKAGVKDKGESEKFWLPAANEGVAEAQYWMGEVLEAKAPSSAANLVEANKWYLIAMAGEDLVPQMMAETASKKLQKKMTPDDIEQSRRLAKSWVAGK